MPSVVSLAFDSASLTGRSSPPTLGNGRPIGRPPLPPLPGLPRPVPTLARCPWFDTCRLYFPRVARGVTSDLSQRCMWSMTHSVGAEHGGVQADEGRLTSASNIPSGPAFRSIPSHTFRGVPCYCEIDESAWNAFVLTLSYITKIRSNNDPVYMSQKLRIFIELFYY